MPNQVIFRNSWKVKNYTRIQSWYVSSWTKTFFHFVHVKLQQIEMNETNIWKSLHSSMHCILWLRWSQSIMLLRMLNYSLKWKQCALLKCNLPINETRISYLIFNCIEPRLLEIKQRKNIFNRNALNEM